MNSNWGENSRSLNEFGVLSVVIPAYNEELVIGETIIRVTRVLETSDIDYEILIVDDGSTDKTIDVLKALQDSLSIRIICLKQNSGHMNAIRVGMEVSTGDYVVTLDADLQDPPEYIPEMLNILTKFFVPIEGEVSSQRYDVVQAFRKNRDADKFWKKTTASMYYFLIRKVTGISILPHAADFRIMTRDVVKTLISLPEKHSVYRLLIPSLGYKIMPFPIERAPRFAGTSKYTSRKMIALALDSLVGFSFRPLRVMTFVGLIAASVLFLASIVTLMVTVFGSTIPGWASIALLLLSSNAFLFASLGLLGEYVGRIYQISQNRPTTPWDEL